MVLGGLGSFRNAWSTWLDSLVIVQSHFLAKSRYCASLAGQLEAGHVIDPRKCSTGGIIHINVLDEICILQVLAYLAGIQFSLQAGLDVLPFVSS
jgi:hypothetical protein